MLSNWSSDKEDAVFLPISGESVLYKPKPRAWRRLLDKQVRMEADTVLLGNLEQTIVMIIFLILEGILVEPKLDYVVIPN